MPHEPKHPENPCLLPEQEQVPAKIWELLRRNKKFLRVVDRLLALDDRARKEERNGNRPGWTASCQVIEAVLRRNLFAGAALQWLVPEPIFFVRHVALPAGLDLTGKQFVATETVRLGEGTGPEPNDSENWRWFERTTKASAESLYNYSGPRIRRGPEIECQTSDDARFAHKVDSLAEWRNYQKQHGPFMVADVWRHVPGGLKRHFEFLWRQDDSRAVGTLTGQRHDAPEPHETQFFQGWRLMEALMQSPGLNRDTLARAIQFDLLADDYRVFAIPKVRSRTEARRIADWLVEKLIRLPDGKELPPREKEIFGTALQWDILLTVADEMAEGAGLEEALMASFDHIHLNGALDRKGQPNQRILWGQRGASWESDYRTMTSPLAGSGLIERIFLPASSVGP